MIGMALKVGFDPFPFGWDGHRRRIACGLEDAPEKNRLVIDIGARPLSEFLQPHPCEIGRGAYEIIVKVDIRTHHRYL